MRKHLKRIGYIAVFFGMLVMANAHWAVLQSIAWSGMLVTYSMRSGLETGIKETFDGEHPCGLCCIISDMKSSEHAPDQLNATVVAVRLLAVAPNAVELSRDRFNYKPLCLKQLIVTDRILDPPPVPPPRGIPS